MNDLADLTYRDMAATLEQHFSESAGNIDEDTTFDDLDLDSLVLVELAVVLSKKYGTLISEADMVDARDFRTLATVVNERRRADAIPAAAE